MDEPRFNEDGTLNDRRHKDDHAELGEILDRRRLNKKRVETVKTSLITGFIFSIFSGLGAIIWYAVKTFTGGNR